MFKFPEYEEDGQEKLSYPNLWRDIEPQQIVGADCFTPYVDLNTDENLIILKLTAIEFTQIFSALYNGAVQTYPQSFMQILVNFLKGLHCPPELPQEDGDCFTYPNYAAFIDYEPTNPFNQPDFVPDGYEFPPFLINVEFDYPEAFGYLATDVFVPFAALTIAPENILTLNYPTLKISVLGTGQIELDLLSVQQGGYAVLKVGSPPNILDILGEIAIETGVKIIDLDSDSLSVPPETDIIIAEEINIEADTGVLTEVYIVFIPKLNDSLLPLGFGGGIRAIGLCGFDTEGVIMGIEDVRFNTENCTFEKRLLGVWEAIDGGDEWLICVEEMMATQAEITDAVVDAAEIISSRFLAGVAGNTEGGITINPDGTIEVGSDGVPVDDPETTGFDERAGAIMGGAISVARAFEAVLDKLDTLYGATNGTPANSEAAAQFFVKAYWPCDEAEMDLAITGYYTYRATNNRLLFATSADFERYLYCNGANEQGITRWLFDVSTFTSPKLNVVYDILVGLADAFFSDYYSAGTQVPSTSYIQSACYPIATEEFTLDFSTAESFTVPLAGTWKDKHRYLIEASGSFADSDETNVTHDFFYSKNSATGVVTFEGFVLNVSGTTAPIAANVPFQSSHSYAVTVDKTGTDGGNFAKNNGTAVAPNVTGIITVRITDLGLIP